MRELIKDIIKGLENSVIDERVKEYAMNIAEQFAYF